MEGFTNLAVLDGAVQKSPCPCLLSLIGKMHPFVPAQCGELRLPAIPAPCPVPHGIWGLLVGIAEKDRFCEELRLVIGRTGSSQWSGD